VVDSGMRWTLEKLGCFRSLLSPNRGKAIVRARGIFPSLLSFGYRFRAEGLRMLRCSVVSRIVPSQAEGSGLAGDDDMKLEVRHCKQMVRPGKVSLDFYLISQLLSDPMQRDRDMGA